VTHPETVHFYRRNLPHWRVAGRPYFVTFNLADSIPANVLARLRREYNQFVQAGHAPDEMLQFYRRRFRRIEAIVDRPQPRIAHLRKPEIARLVLGSLDWVSENLGWHVPSAVVMPNHFLCGAPHSACYAHRLVM